LVFSNTATCRNAEQKIPSLHLLTLCETGSAHDFMLLGVKNVKIIRNMSMNNEIHKSYNRALKCFLIFTKCRLNFSGDLFVPSCTQQLHGGRFPMVINDDYSSL